MHIPIVIRIFVENVEDKRYGILFDDSLLPFGHYNPEKIESNSKLKFTMRKARVGT